MFFPYFSLFISRLFFSFFFYSASAMSATYKRKEELICFYLTVLFFLLALPSSVHPKILTRFYLIYFKILHKISAQSDGRIENYTQ
jgi:hypothetical protein